MWPRKPCAHAATAMVRRGVLRLRFVVLLLPEGGDPQDSMTGEVSRHGSKTRPVQLPTCDSKLLEAAADRVLRRAAELEQLGFIASHDVHDCVLALRLGMELRTHHHGSFWRRPSC